jgi:hypothetical protein
LNKTIILNYRVHFFVNYDSYFTVYVQIFSIVSIIMRIVVWDSLVQTMWSVIRLPRTYGTKARRENTPSLNGVTPNIPVNPHSPIRDMWSLWTKMRKIKINLKSHLFVYETWIKNGTNMRINSLVIFISNGSNFLCFFWRSVFHWVQGQ